MIPIKSILLSFNSSKITKNNIITTITTSNFNKIRGTITDKIITISILIKSKKKRCSLIFPSNFKLNSHKTDKITIIINFIIRNIIITITIITTSSSNIKIPNSVINLSLPSEKAPIYNILSSNSSKITKRKIDLYFWFFERKF